MILGSKSKIFPLVKLVAESFLTMSTLDQDQLFHTLRIMHIWEGLFGHSQYTYGIITKTRYSCTKMSI